MLDFDSCVSNQIESRSEFSRFIMLSYMDVSKQSKQIKNLA